MGINAGKVENVGGFKREDPLQPGGYPARLVWVIDMGVQKQDPFEGKEKPPAPRVYTTYELNDEFLHDEDGKELKDKPRFYSEHFPLYSLSSDRAKSTVRYLALDPKSEYGGDWAKLIGRPITVNIANKKKQRDGTLYDKIGSTSTMRDKEADKLNDLVNEPKVFDFDEPDLDVFLSLPEWLQDTIKDAVNFKGSPLEAMLEGGPKEDQESEKESSDAEDQEDW